MHTTKGDIEIELFENQAPETVGNFISLVESDFYVGRVFHRVIENFMAQTGCPIGDGSGGPGYTIYGETDRPGARKYFRGTVGMALSGHPDSGGSQFFITFLPRPDLDGQYTAFGRVTAGIDVLGDLVRVNPESEDEEKKKPAAMLDEIVSIEVLFKRDHEYQPNKVK
ncbi:MAG: peptidylprolyl isomerase [Pirellulaceae bacterium]|nr:peptidylprolyl isomerase [Pirellulaceae bacterium]